MCHPRVCSLDPTLDSRSMEPKKHGYDPLRRRGAPTTISQKNNPLHKKKIQLRTHDTHSRAKYDDDYESTIKLYPKTPSPNMTTTPRACKRFGKPSLSLGCFVIIHLLLFVLCTVRLRLSHRPSTKCNNYHHNTPVSYCETESIIIVRQQLIRLVRAPYYTTTRLV